jgi:hypothetical protein
MGTGGAPCVCLERDAAWRVNVNVSGSTSGVFKALKEDLKAPASPKERTLTEEEDTCRLRETLGRVLMMPCTSSLLWMLRRRRLCCVCVSGHVACQSLPGAYVSQVNRIFAQRQATMTAWSLQSSSIDRVHLCAVIIHGLGLRSNPNRVEANPNNPNNPKTLIATLQP